MFTYAPIPAHAVDLEDATVMNIAPSETVLTGAWITRDGRVVSDDVTQRIESLVSAHLILL